MRSSIVSRLAAASGIGLLLASLLAASTVAPVAAAGPSVIWTKQFGTGGPELGGRIAVDRAGRSFVVGITGGAFPGQVFRGETDGFIRRMRPGGAVMWTRQFGTALDDFVTDVDATPKGRSFVVGGTTGTLPGQTHHGASDAFVRAYRPGGSAAWTRQFGTAGNDQAFGVAVDRRGRVYTVGITEGALPGQASHGSYDAFIRRYHPLGAVAWTRQFGTGTTDGALAVAVDRLGRIYVAGVTDGTLGGPNRGDTDVFLRRYRPNGSVVWTRQFGSAGADHVADMVVDRQGRIVVAGSTNGTLPGLTNRGGHDAFVRVFRPNGSVVWTRQFGSAGDEEVGAVTVDKGRRVYVVGSTNGALPGLTNRGGLDAFVRKLRSNGSVAWSRQFGSPETDFGVGAAIDRGSHLLVSGATTGALPGQVLQGLADNYVRKFR